MKENLFYYKGYADYTKVYDGDTFVVEYYGIGKKEEFDPSKKIIVKLI